MLRKNGLKVLLLSFITGFLGLGFLSNTAIWQKSSRGIYEADIRNLTISPTDDALIYAGTSKALYKSSDRGKNYRVILRPSGEQGGINDVHIPLEQPSVIYAATDAGLYESRNAGRTWNRIYYSSNMESRQCLSVSRHDHRIYLGTRNGLFQKTDGETNWRKMKEGLDNRPVYHIVQDEHFLYLATGQMLFNLDKKTRKIQKIFSLGIGESRGENGMSDQVSTMREDQFIKFIEISGTPQPYLFVASSKGIYWSSANDGEWHRLPTNNIALEELTSLVILEKNIFDEGDCPEVPMGCLRVLAGTKKGVFFLSHGKWMPVYKGMETNEISYLAKNTRGTVYAATAKGIFYLPVEEALPFLIKESQGEEEIEKLKRREEEVKRFVDNFNIEEFFRDEPTINQVHALAINYAEVDYEKIANWRTLARKKALMPGLSVGLDRDGSDLFHWNTGASPDELQKGRDYVDWDVSLSWDLADLIWSTDQTTIDSRSKLMVELREDILNEVTRLYFERRRIRVELAADSFLDPALKIDKEMRIAELTALIDALTRGEFSKRIRKRN